MNGCGEPKEVLLPSEEPEAEAEAETEPEDEAERDLDSLFVSFAC